VQHSVKNNFHCYSFKAV